MARLLSSDGDLATRRHSTNDEGAPMIAATPSDFGFVHSSIGWSRCGECEVHDKPIDLVDVAGVLDGNPRAVMFTAAGPEKAELVGNVMGSRRRLALALDTDERALMETLQKRLEDSAQARQGRQDAPVQQVVRKGDEADLCALAGASAARPGRGALHLGEPRLRALSRQRLHQCGLPPHHAARSAPGRHRPDRAERPAGDLSRERRPARSRCRSPTRSARIRPISSLPSRRRRRWTSST